MFGRETFIVRVTEDAMAPRVRAGGGRWPAPPGVGPPWPRACARATSPSDEAVARGELAPRVRAGDYVWIDPDEPAADGRLVAVRDPGRGGETVVRLLVERDGRRTLRALDGRCPERTVDAGNETDIRGVVVFVGNTV